MSIQILGFCGISLEGIVLISGMQKEQLRDALAKRDKMERRMKEIIAFLNQPGLYATGE